MQRPLHAFEKFHAAVRELARPSGSPQERLAAAYIYHLHHLRLDEMPAALRPHLGAIHEGMTRRQARADEGSVAATVRQMSDDEARRPGDLIASVEMELARDVGT